MFARFKQLYAPKQKIKRIKNCGFGIHIRPIDFGEIGEYMDIFIDLEDDYSFNIDNTHFKVTSGPAKKDYPTIIKIRSDIPDYTLPEDMYKFYQTYNALQFNECINAQFLDINSLETDYKIGCNNIWKDLEITDVILLNINNWVKFLIQENDSFYINLNNSCCDFGTVIVNQPENYWKHNQTVIVAKSFTEFITKLVDKPIGFIKSSTSDCTELGDHLLKNCVCYHHGGLSDYELPFFYSKGDDYNYIMNMKRDLQFFINNSFSKYLVMEILEPYSNLTFYEGIKLLKSKIKLQFFKILKNGHFT